MSLFQTFVLIGAYELQILLLSGLWVLFELHRVWFRSPIADDVVPLIDDNWIQ